MTFPQASSEQVAHDTLRWQLHEARQRIAQLEAALVAREAADISANATRHYTAAEAWAEARRRLVAEGLLPE